ncbi:hypothetical protein RAJCM14343_2352 [Rhodococcus aetherivorans]|jgi:hypothetical protein|uniref:Uncharacterized protein n=1 Tax=Rhodococcus aetherivorans TaxID=191292 RepID=N1M830_9NOCA|nr:MULTISPECIES: hypothetical protein [Rhodococcus]ETT27437.1 hypothetical protein RR21198_1990 [Rhodococcus rhodochrous ATCC 21198]NCL76258.1 hypothetical protein [Rhodococcus sp. YH1]AKE88058.1 hypothetical protein AAT18_01115 [Rhodococcus aetherivorans]ANZ27330.1 hypothetical protein A4U64_23610 [Rhodococcus sp. WB1]MDV6295397.1 hypothetical protein [Rhodococcus aetherivorans]
MSDWVCRLVVSTESGDSPAQLHMVLRDDLTDAEVLARVLGLVHEFYGPGVQVDDLKPESWAQTRTASPVRSPGG